MTVRRGNILHTVAGGFIFCVVTSALVMFGITLWWICSFAITGR